MRTVPLDRVRTLNEAPVRADGNYVLYWMVANRRTRWNHALQRAVEHAVELTKPVLVLEPLRLDYPHASERFHAFVVEGMRDNQAACAKAGVRYLPYVEREPGAGKGLLETLAARACLVVTDDWPSFFLPTMLGTAAARLPVLLEAVDACGLLPLSTSEAAFPTAYAFRRFLQRTLPDHLAAMPSAEPLSKRRWPGTAVVPREVSRRWPASIPSLSSLPIDHGVPAVTERPGGMVAARARLNTFLKKRLPHYAEERNHPDIEAASGLSPYLHFGHVSPHEVFAAMARKEGWSLDDLSPRADGKRTGWWGMSPDAEAFLDQLCTWRELGFHFGRHRSDAMTWEGLPDWARATLTKHATDERTHTYDLDVFEAAATHDPLWNAAQRQLRREGTIQNYLRMLWGKMVLAWSPSPRAALTRLIHLNDRWALDGRDPNSYSGIGWCLGRFDRPWGPERPVFGTVRYMTSQNTARKLKLGNYLAIFGNENKDQTRPRPPEMA